MTRCSPPPTAVAVLVLISLGAVACGGGGGGGGGEFADAPTALEVAAGDEPGPYPLAEGRYRLTITEDCEEWNVTITQDGGEFTYEKGTTATRIHFVSDVPGGNYLVAQTVESCTDWSIDLVRVSGG